MPFLYNKKIASSDGSGGTGGTGEYVLPTFSINTNTMDQIATQAVNDPVTFSMNDDAELLTEV